MKRKGAPEKTPSRAVHGRPHSTDVLLSKFYLNLDTLCTPELPLIGEYCTPTLAVRPPPARRTCIMRSGLDARGRRMRTARAALDGSLCSVGDTPEAV